jgi:hypothetical protein
VIISTGNPDFFLELSPELVPEPNGQEESQRCDKTCEGNHTNRFAIFPNPSTSGDFSFDKARTNHRDAHLDGRREVKRGTERKRERDREGE